MSSIVYNVTKGIVAFCDINNLLEELNELPQGENEQQSGWPLKAAAIVNKLALLGFTCVEAKGILNGASSKELQKLKHKELFVRFFSWPIKWIQESSKPTSNLQEKIRLLEKGIIAPMADVARVGNEMGIYHEKSFLELPPEELAEAKRPIYEYDSYEERLKIVGYKSVNIDECNVNIEEHQQTAAKASLVRGAAEVRVISTLTHAGLSVYEKLAHFMNWYSTNGPHPQNQTTRQAQITTQERTEEEEGFDLLKLKIIPDALHEDAVFSKYICPITFMPIRKPIGDPNGETIYEKSAIRNWLLTNAFSPMTRQPLRFNQLIEKPGIRALIDHRLKHHEKKLWEYLQNHESFRESLRAEADEMLQAVADAELRHLAQAE